MERLRHAVGMTAAEEVGFVVSCRDLPQLVTQGDDLAHSLAEAADAMDEVFPAYMQGGLVLPTPSKARKGERISGSPACPPQAMFALVTQSSINASSPITQGP
jgi:antitoxin HicB